MQGSHEPSRVVSARITERMAQQIDDLVFATHLSANTVVTMLLSQGLRSPELMAAFRLRGGRR